VSVQYSGGGPNNTGAYAYGGVLGGGQVATYTNLPPSLSISIPQLFGDRIRELPFFISFGVNQNPTSTTASGTPLVSPPNPISITVNCNGVQPIIASLRALQLSTTPIIAQISGQAVTGAINSAVDAGFSGNAVAFTPNGSGFTYYFDPVASDQDDVKSFLSSPNRPGRRIDDDFAALGYARGTKGLPRPVARLAQPSDWLAWIDVRGTNFKRSTFGSDLNGDQINAVAGLSRRFTPNFLLGVLGGYEHFDYSSQAFLGRLKGDGWTVGAYLAWRFAPHWRFDAAAAGSDIFAGTVVSNAVLTDSGNFTGRRWLVSSGITGSYGWRVFVLEPSARVYALWEHENTYTDSLGTLQNDRNFSTGRASGGVKVSYPLVWWGTVNLVPYAGLYGDYYFSRDDTDASALTSAGLTTVPLLQGWSARVTGGVAMRLDCGAQFSAGGEFGGMGGSTRIWTWRVNGSVPF
jgi:hypothetical protein